MVEYIALGISLLALTFPILKYVIVERGRLNVFMSHFTHPNHAIDLPPKEHPVILCKNIGKTAIQNLKFKVIEEQSILTTSNRSILVSHIFHKKVLEPNTAHLIHIFNEITLDEKFDAHITGKDRQECICIEAQYTDIFRIHHTDRFTVQFYHYPHQPNTEIENISHWLRMIRDEFRNLHNKR